MFYHADYYRIIINAYDYECSWHHASFHIYVWGVSLLRPPPPPTTHTHTHTNEPMKKTYESQREGENEEKENKKGRFKIYKKVKS